VAKHPARCPRCGNRLEVDTAVDERIICSNCQASLSLPGKAKLSDKVDPLIGQTLGEFEIVEFLGRGGMGAVYKARQASLDRLVAIKVLPRAFSRDASFLERFGREARAAAAVNHPNIIEIYSVGHERGYQYIAMEFIDGESLADILKREGQLPADRALALMKQVAAAVGEAHAAGILHRDIKPSNILLTTRGLAKVADFGLAKRPGAELSVTATGAPIGTPLYMPPEVAQGKPLDSRSHLYSLGAAFYHALAGRPPFQGESAAEVILQHAEAQVPPLTQAAPDAPPALCRTIHRLLRKNPAERYPSAEELLVALQRVEARLSVSQGEPTRTMPGAAHPSPVVLGRQGGRPPGEKDVAQPPSAVREQRRAAVPHGEKAARPAIAKPGPKVPPWDAAWKKAEAVAKSLLSEQRFGEAMTVYEKLASRFEDARLTDRAQKAVFATLDQAKTAYQEVEKRAKGLLAERKFEEARAALRPVIERYGVPGRKEQAEQLARQIDAAEKAARSAAAKAAQEAAKEAERERREAERKKRQDAEARYTKALKPVEAMIRAWDYRGAAEALAKLDVGGVSVPRELAKRLATRRDEVQRLARLKAKMIQRINTAKPRLQRRSLLIRGINADLVKAHEKGITAKLPTGKTELHTWGSLTARSVQQLVQRSIDRKSGGDWLAAGILSLALKDAKSAERHFEKARSLGAKIDRYLDPLAAASFARAKALLDEARGAETPRLQKDKRFAEADAALASIEKKYAKTPWFASHKDDFAAAREAAKAGIAEAEAEKLYAQAARHFKKKELWELKPLVEKLKTDYPNTKPVTDAARKPSFAEMLEATAKLGKFLTVRKDGKGDFKTIQAAIDAAPPNSLIEIQGEGRYAEKVVIPQDKPRLTLRGRSGCLPLIVFKPPPRTTVGSSSPAVAAERTVLERLALGTAHVAAARCRVRSCIVGYLRIDPWGTLENCVIGRLAPRGDVTVRNTAIISWVDPRCRKLDFENTFCPRFLYSIGASCQFRFCTIPAVMRLTGGPNAILDSIVPRIISAERDSRIEHCDVYDKEPFWDNAKPGKGCFSRDPLFRDPTSLDYRLKPTSPCRGKASDGGDIGCRYTAEMLEMLKLALKLRKKGIIKF